MAGLEQFDEAVKKFNETHGVEFSFQVYETNVLKLNNLSRYFLGKQKSHENVVYQSTLLNLYRAAVINMVEGSDKLVDHTALVNDFEKLMSGYRKYCKENNKRAPGRKGGWKDGVEVLTAMKESIRDIKETKSEYVKEKYLTGQIRLRDMRARLETIQKSDPITSKQLAELMNYRSALESTVKERSVWWKARHLIRNNAEQRDLKALDEFLKGYEETPVYGDAQLIANERAVTTAKSLLDVSIEQNKLAAQEIQENKEKVEINTSEIESNVNTETKDNSKIVEESKLTDEKEFQHNLKEDVNGKEIKEKSVPKIEEKKPESVTLSTN